jgi:Trk-type K+ transport system membrane component
MMTMFIQAAGAPQDLPQATPARVSADQAISQIKAGSIFTDKNLTLTYVVLAFGLLALVTLYMMVRYERLQHSELRHFELRIFTITILIFGSLLVVAADFGTDQLTPLIGFFGTIAGYILGRGDRPPEPEQKPDGRNESR